MHSVQDRMGLCTAFGDSWCAQQMGAQGHNMHALCSLLTRHVFLAVVCS